MQNGKEVPYMRTSEGQGYDLPDRQRLDAPWFSRPDPLYFPGYMFAEGEVSFSLLGENVKGANGIFEELVSKHRHTPLLGL